MKVIKSTKVNWATEVKCSWCESILLIEETDLFQETTKTGVFAKFTCCECNKKTTFWDYPEPSILPESSEPTYASLDDLFTLNLNTDKPKLRYINGQTIFEFETASAAGAAPSGSL